MGTYPEAREVGTVHDDQHLRSEKDQVDIGKHHLELDLFRVTSLTLGHARVAAMTKGSGQGETKRADVGNRAGDVLCEQKERDRTSI